MTEDDARAAVEKMVGASATAKLERLTSFVAEENGRQNLIAASTVPRIWARHVWDSIQLLHWAPPQFAAWIDIGTGGGFPGLVIACATDLKMTLVEPRKRRADFLAATAARLGLAHVRVEARRIEGVLQKADVITARAVSSIENILRMAQHCATPSTRWLLPRGVMATDELSTLRARFVGTFHVEQSLSEDRSVIVIANGVKAR